MKARISMTNSFHAIADKSKTEKDIINMEPDSDLDHI